MPAQVISLQKYKDDRAVENQFAVMFFFFPFLIWPVMWSIVWK